MLSKAKGTEKNMANTDFLFKKKSKIEETIEENMRQFDDEKKKINKNQERLEKIERLLETYENEKVKIKQNQERLDSIEHLLNTDYINEKTKIKQNQIRLDNIEHLISNWKKENEKTSFLNKRTNSQCGEDAIMAYVLANLAVPFDKCSYLDLGANHPIEGNNTYFFYTQGARGVLVEANPELIFDLKEKRPKDIVLNKCVSNETGLVSKFYVMSDDGLSTASQKSAEEFHDSGSNIFVKKIIDVSTISVNEIFEHYFDKAPEICSIDIEGKEMEILQSIDFMRFRPLLISIEMIEYSNKIAINRKRMDIYNYMISKNYAEYAFTGVNSIFVDAIALKENWGYNI